MLCVIIKIGSLGAEVSLLREELAASQAAAARWDERISQARAACSAWQRESEEAQRAAALAERQRDEAEARAGRLRRELEAARASAAAARDWRGLPLPALKALLTKTRADVDEMEKLIYLETATKCLRCEERPRAVTLAPCNHYALCEPCADTATECPYCQAPITR